MKSANAFSILVALLVVFATMSRGQSPARGNSEKDLGGTSWELVRFQGGDDKTLTPDDKSKYTVAFDRGGSVSVRIDCNRGRGTWKLSAQSQLVFGPLALTRAMCPGAALNDRMARDWEHVRSYVIKDGHLSLALMADGGTYEFEPMAAEALTASPTGLPASFAGTLPCADCPGIRYQVNLLPNRTFVSRMTYLERNVKLDDQGNWQPGADGKTLTLQGARGAREKYALLDANTLRKLDADGSEIHSKFNYDLKRSQKFVAIEAEGQQTNAAALEGTDWRLVSLGSTPINSASKQQEPYLLLSAESHRVSGSGGCNRLVGNYELSGGQLTFGKVAGTMMACISGMDTEKAFLDALAQVRNWKISGRVLELLDADGHVLARLEPR